jgi:S-adenosylmethionine/arginine decarboxylase-like enzyme
MHLSTTSSAAPAPDPRPWGTTVLLDARGIPRARLAALPEVLQFLHDLPPAIGMTAYGRPQVERFGTPGSRMYGYTGVQLITTSHIALHACELVGELYLDITTCGDIDPAAVAEITAGFWGAAETRVRVWHRDAGAPLTLTAATTD